MTQACARKTSAPNSAPIVYLLKVTRHGHVTPAACGMKYRDFGGYISQKFAVQTCYSRLNKVECIAVFNVLVFVILVMPPEGGQLSCETNLIFTFVTPIQL